MTRLYYDCIYEALYMQHYFGVKFEEEIFGSRFNKVYIKKESEHIFEPKEQDWGWVKTRIGITLFHFKLGCWAGQAIGVGDPEICERDNKHFFQPKTE